MSIAMRVTIVFLQIYNWKSLLQHARYVRKTKICMRVEGRHLESGDTGLGLRKLSF